MALSLTTIDSSFSVSFLGYFFFSLVYERTIPCNDIRVQPHFSVPCVLQILRNDICEYPIMECENTCTHHTWNKQKLHMSFTVPSHVHSVYLAPQPVTIMSLVLPTIYLSFIFLLFYVKMNYNK